MRMRRAVAVGAGLTLALSGVSGFAATAAQADPPSIITNWSGPWRQGATYGRGAIVRYDNALWIATRGNAGARPRTGSSVWDKLLPAAQGPRAPAVPGVPPVRRASRA